jgi:hypothetical protein
MTTIVILALFGCFFGGSVITSLMIISGHLRGIREELRRPVCTERQVAALDTAVEVIGASAMLADPVIREAARYVELDEPERALIVLRNITDLTGAYRLLAVLCAEPTWREPA